MSFQEPSLGANIYPPDLSQFLTKYFNDKGVETHGGMDIQGIDTTDQGYVLKSKDGRTVTADHLIAGIGIRPNIELAQAAGIAIADPASGGGILVDKYLQTNIPDIYSAGDVASFYNYGLGRTMRVEHADNARSMGRIAGLNMAGNEIVYDHLPFFYSDLFDLGYEAVGELTTHNTIFADWKEQFKEGVIYYLNADKIRGVLLWNVWDQVNYASCLITQGESYTTEKLKGLVPLS